MKTSHKTSTFVSGARLRELSFNLALALLYIVFLRIFLADFLAHGRLSSLIFVLVETIFIYFILTRRPPRELSHSVPAWIAAFAGSFLPLLLRPAPGGDTLTGEIVQVAGVLLIGVSILSLGKSFGLVAANRGVVTDGMYKHIRHPLYLSYGVNLIGFLLNHYSTANAAIVFLAVLAQLVRIEYEEQLLLRDASYREYAHRTRWRIFPYLY